MAERQVYVVMGTTGEYSDRTEWSVRAFLDEGDAQALVVAATERGKAIEASKASPYASTDEKNEHDPAMSMDYTGTTYYYLTVPLVGQDETIAAIVAEDEVRQVGIRAIRLKPEVQS